MKGKLWLAAAALCVPACVWAQTAAAPGQTPPEAAPSPPEPRPALVSVELGGFANFVNSNYGRWTGGSGRFTYLGAKRFTPSFGFATQHRPEGTQSTFGMDSYITGSRWFYMVAGVGGSPEGSAILFPKLRYGITGLITIPQLKGLVPTLGASQVHGDGGGYGRTLAVGALYYQGRAIWSGNLSFNRNYPGAVPSKSGALGIQYGTDKKYWIGGGMAGGRIAYQTIALRPLDVRFLTFGPYLFYQKWISPKWAIVLKYDYQNQIDAFQRHGVAASIFFEVP